jgi:CDP-4-dehydro-6-deoxyglucose reductase
MNFKVQVLPSNHEFTTETDETLLDAALRQGISLPYGCRNGRCGTCVSQLLSGDIAYPSGNTEALEGAGADACLVCQAVPLSDLSIQVREVETGQEIEVKTLPCRVVEIEHLAHDVIRLYLKLPENQRLQFLAGQYLDFILSDGRKRAFSIANAPHDDELIELHIRHVGGGKFTDYVFSKMKEKAVLRIEAPLGSYYLREDSQRPVILMGGGTGFAPLKAIIEHAFYLGITRPMHLFWGVRSQRDLYLKDLPEHWAETHENFRYTPVLSEPDADWTGRTGWVHDAVVADYPDLSGHDLYMSGPPPMINAAKDSFIACGLTMDNMYSDAFEYAADSPQTTKEPGAQAAQSTETD